MELYIDEKEKYVLVKEYFAESTGEYKSFWEDLCSKYHGWEIDFVYRNCDPPIEFLASINAEILDNDVITNLTKENFTPTVKRDALRITSHNFHIFAEIHDKTNPEMYWNSTRIAEILDRWCIYMRGNSYVLMSIGREDESEIYALEVTDANEGALLLSMAAEFAFDENGKANVLYFIDVGFINQREAAMQVGFAVCGRSVSYRGRIL